MSIISFFVFAAFMFCILHPNKYVALSLLYVKITKSS